MIWTIIFVPFDRKGSNLFSQIQKSEIDDLALAKPDEAIGGEPPPHDFCAEAQGIVIGRIRRFEHGELRDCWEYNLQLGHSSFRCGDDEGHADTRDDAIAAIKARFARFIATPHAEGGGRDLPRCDGWRAVVSAKNLIGVSTQKIGSQTQARIYSNC